MDKNGVQVSNAPNNESPSSSEVEAARSAGKKRAALSGDNSDGGDGGNEEKNGGNNREVASTGHAKYLWSERERRKKMKNMYTILHGLLPQLPAKVELYTIVDEAVKHIKTLENTLNNLQKQKAERLQSIKATREAVYKTWTSSNIALNVCGHDAHINICCSMKPGLLSALCFVMEKYEIDVISINVSSDHNRSMYMIHTRVREYACQLPIEEIYKEAAGEIAMLCE